MTKKRRRPVSKRPSEATTNNPRRGQGPVAGLPCGIDIVAAIAAKQSMSTDRWQSTDPPRRSRHCALPPERRAAKD